MHSTGNIIRSVSIRLKVFLMNSRWRTLPQNYWFAVAQSNFERFVIGKIETTSTLAVNRFVLSSGPCKALPWYTLVYTSRKSIQKQSSSKIIYPSIFGLSFCTKIVQKNLFWGFTKCEQIKGKLKFANVCKHLNVVLNRGTRQATASNRQILPN